MTVVVVGAGLAGLSAAWELQQASRDPGVIVLEEGHRAGGVIVTERRDGFVVEGGPDGFLAAEPDIQDLARELGIGDRLVDQLAKGSTLWTGAGLERLDEGRAAQLLGIQPAEGGLERGFRSFAGGMADIVEALTARLGDALRVDQGVSGMAPAARGGWRIAVTGGSELQADAVILAVPGWATARFLSAAGVPPARELDQVLYFPSTTVSLAYREDQLPGGLEGTGFVAAGEAAGAVRACSYSWRKYPHRAPPGHALLRAFLSPVDGDPSAAAHAELVRILGIQGAPLWTRAFHWRRALPRYKRGHAERVAAIRERLERLAPIDIAGSAIDGAGVSACVKSGRAAARRVLSRLGG